MTSATLPVNNRLQVTEFKLGTTQGASNTWHLTNEYGELQSGGSVDASKNNGNIAKQTVNFSGLANPFVQSYKYDSLDRISEGKETVNGTQTWIQNWGYDRYGNRSSFTKNVLGNTTVSNPTIDASTNRFNTGQNYTYDKNGNIVDDPFDGGRKFTYNGDNKQTQAKVGKTVVGTYSYDGEGKRVKKVTGAESTVFVYSNGRLVEERNSSTNALVTSYLYAGSQLLASETSTATNYTVTDHLGSPRVVVNGSGTVVSRRDFLPFGEELFADGTYRKTSDNYSTTGTDAVRQRFTGYQKDIETGLDFAEARMYQNQHGRFTAIDPLLASGKSANPQTFNRYVYVTNSPLRFVDPDGLQIGAVFCSSCSERERAFIDKHPLAATQIGSHGMENDNLASTVLRVTNNIGLSSATPLGDERGSQRNAFRHVFLAALTTLKLGPEIAKEATDAHEVSGSVDLAQLPSKDEDLVDQAIDLENNAIGIELGKTAREGKATAKETAAYVLVKFKEEGFFTAKKTKDGSFTIERTRITEQEFSNAAKEIMRRDEKGFSPEYLERKRKEEKQGPIK